jgi:hypothetical protein
MSRPEVLRGRGHKSSPAQEKQEVGKHPIHNQSTSDRQQLSIISLQSDGNQLGWYNQYASEVATQSVVLTGRQVSMVSETVER